MKLLMRLVGLKNGVQTPFDGQFIREFDPAKATFTPDGRCLPWLSVTPDVAEAKRYINIDALMTDRMGLTNFDVTATQVEE